MVLKYFQKRRKAPSKRDRTTEATERVVETTEEQSSDGKGP
ncbi:UNVERIFIED_CONTAM: hypothetical protein BJ099_11287 [Lysinibacillus xylanilyticus]